MTWRIRSFESNGNAYFTSSRGVRCGESASSQLRFSGVPRALDLQTALVAGSLLSASQTRGYRICWILRDTNNNLIVGHPGARAYVTAAGAENPQLTIRIPSAITTSHYFQVYCTEIATSGDPGDNMVLIYERQPTTAELAAGTITFTDTYVDALRNISTPLYTNESIEGLANGNTDPPIARDVCLFRDHALYANFTDKHRMTLQLIDAASLVAATSSVTIAGVTYLADATETIASATFKKYTAGSVAQNIADTAQSLCRVINGYAGTSRVNAFYVSTPDTIPGKILLEERGIGDDVFYATCNNSTTSNTFYPPIPTSGSTYFSVADRRKNRIRVSKQQQPEHCPLARELVVGEQNDEIQRIVPLRDSVIVIKDRTIWRITGSVFEDFTATILDDTCSIAGRDSAVKLNNAVFMLSNQGFVSITDNGVQIVGRPEENRVLAGLDYRQSPNHDLIVAGASEARRLYVCACGDSDGNGQVAYCYNAITRQWSRWLIDANCFGVLDDRLMYGLRNTLGHILLERSSVRDGDPEYRDFSDESATFTISAKDSNANTLTGTFAAGVNYSSTSYASLVGDGSGLGYGWKIVHSGKHYLVTDWSGPTLTLNTVTDLPSSGDVTLYRPIPMTLEYNPITAGNPGELKQFGDVVIRLEKQMAHKVTTTYYNEKDTKTTAYFSDWTTTPGSNVVYVGDSGSSATNNDVTATTLGAAYPFFSLRDTVTKARTVGQQLSVRLYNSVADCRLGIKSIIVQVRSLASNKVKQ
jgi:hypothetical protein